MSGSADRSADAPPVDHDTTPPAHRGMQAVAVVLLVIPVIALLWVDLYARDTPRLFGFPFFFWYQLAWIPLCSLCTYGAYILVKRARPHRPMAAVETPASTGEDI